MIVPIETQNSFSPLADLVDEPEDSIIVGDSMIVISWKNFVEEPQNEGKDIVILGRKSMIHHQGSRGHY